MNKNEIEKIIPYRDPFLMLDEVEIDEEGKSGRGYKKLTGDEYYFEGHFPDRPVMPGVLIIESITQTSMVILKKDRVALKKVNKMKFRRTIEPGDKLEIKVNLTDEKDGMYRFSGEVNVNGSIAASGEITLGKSA
ncbi:MAG: 3-hydroxyacyl-ACP dehydratase FabZ [Elusimicrobiota bacterium]